MTEEKKLDALVPLGNGAMMERPSYIPESTEGTEHITRDDVTIPRIAIAQGLSPQMIEGDPKCIEGLKLGDLFNNLTEQIYGRGPLEFFVVRGDKPRGVEFIPLNEGGGVKDFNVALDDPRMQFWTNDEGERKKPIATKFYDFIIVLLPSLETVALSFKSTGLKIARDLNSFIRLRKAPIWSGKYMLSSAVQKKGTYTYGVYQIGNAGFLGENEAEWSKAMFDVMKDKRLEIARDQSDADEVIDVDSLPEKPPF